MMVYTRCVLAAVICLAILPLETGALKSRDPPSIIQHAGPPEPEEDGIVVQDVVNVFKDMIIVVVSNPDQFAERQHARDTWMQPLNRSSEYSLPKADRKRITVWHAIPTGRQLGLRQEVVAEGKRTGDIIEIQTDLGMGEPDDFSNFGAVLRWLRVAYFKRFKTVLYTNVDSFVSIYNILPFLNGVTPYYYGGYLNSYEPNKDRSLPQKYYAPFVESGTIVLGSDAVELIARELEYIRHLPRFDATIGNFFMPFQVVKPSFDNRFVAKKESVYSDLQSPIVINHLSPDEISQFSKAKCSNGVCRTPPMPAQTQELKSTYVYVNPIPSGEEPLCSGIDGVKCNMDALKSLMPK